MNIAKVSIGVILAGALGILVASWNSDFTEAPDRGTSNRGSMPPNPASAEKAQALSFDLLAQTVMNEKPPPAYPQTLRALAGKRVRVTGFIAPYNDPQKMTKLLLLRSPSGGCFFCNPPEINAMVFVRRVPKDPALDQDGQPMTFEGTLQLWTDELGKNDEARQFLFTLDDASVLTTR